MWVLYKKEIASFFSSLVGYISIIVFLVITGLFLWFIGNDSNAFNVLEGNYANLDGLFIIAPWVFLFLVPAITMKMFSEERKAGTIEFLNTKPLTDIQIILAKFFAGLTLVLFSLLPTLVYVYTVYQLGYPKGNMDVGGTIGSYVGLLFLGAAFTAISLFASAITDNQVIAFILGMLLCFICYIGFGFLADTGLFGDYGYIALLFGIDEHYGSISRGVIDSRDIIYYLSLISFFVLLTKLILVRRKW
jgi:ABC-2 type transport system permease protein